MKNDNKLIVKDEVRNRELIRNMTPRKRLEHIWFYHSFAIKASLVLIFIVAILIGERQEMNKTPVLTLGFLNCTYTKGDIQDISKDYLKQSNYSTWHYKIDFYDELVPTVAESARANDIVSVFTESNSLDSLLSSDDPLDIIFSTENDILGKSEDDYTFEDHMKNLEKVFSSGFLKKHKDELIYDKKTGYPIGLDMKNSLMVKEHGTFQSQTILFVSAYTDRPEEIASFVEFLFRN